MDENVLFLEMGNAINNQKKQRIKGYYVCPRCGEFLKAIARRTSACPFCGREASLIMQMDSIMEQVTTSVWKDSGCYSDVRADVRRKETA